MKNALSKIKAERKKVIFSKADHFIKTKTI